MTTKKLKRILIPCLSTGVAIPTITPAIVLSNRAIIKIKYEDYGMVCTINEKFDLPFYLNDPLGENEDIKMNPSITFMDPGFSNLIFDPVHPVDIDGKHITYHFQIDIDWSKIKEDQGNFLALSCNFICFKKDTKETL